MTILKFLVLFFSFLFYENAFAQGSKLQANLVQTTHIYAEKPTWIGWQKIYKKFISSQDGEVCTFYPSCSSFAHASIKKQGFIIGIFLSTDRLIRCNGRPGNYFEDENEKKLDLP
jgi:putative component of membrane protein insertase Oxa1/YidC/SpoIIIJ protein YidD